MRRSLFSISYLLYLIYLSVTNHVGHVISGELGAVANGMFEIGSRRIPLSALPVSERLRIKALAGQDVRTPWERKVDADLAVDLKRIDARRQEGELTEAQVQKLRRSVHAAADYRREKGPPPQVRLGSPSLDGSFFPGAVSGDQ